MSYITFIYFGRILGFVITILYIMTRGIGMSNIALQVERLADGTVVSGGNVIFDTIVY